MIFTTSSYHLEHFCLLLVERRPFQQFRMIWKVKVNFLLVCLSLFQVGAIHNFYKNKCLLILCFLVILTLYLPVTVGGYLVYGEDVDPNLTFSLSKTWIVTVANISMAIHLILAFLIVINPVCQELEEIFNIPHCKIL